MSPARFPLVTFLVFALASNGFAETMAKSAEPSVVCREADVKLAIWSSQSAVTNVDYGSHPATMQVDWQRWMALPFKFQEDLAKAAYCRVQFDNPGATLEVRNGDRLVGSITNGVWHNYVSGE
ncbi:hypothetical protein [Rhizobium sp. 2MFCol3.1]|uniref:hypothetical protein n=1 Tax=Rhizobium sp. 2MFCol3.1 TaxID=1246459 RepID=UPI00037E7794|nr:hypothetical protein [Rhizobium sp. 2MFCol3.1]